MARVHPLHKRVLLLVTPNTYRAPAFASAAEKLGIEVVYGIDVPAQLSVGWRGALPLDFRNSDEAVRKIVTFAHERPLDAILAVDDSGTVLAAQASAALGLPHNPPEAAEAARNKHRMRQLLAAAGVPSPAFQLFSAEDDPAQVAHQVEYPCVVKPLLLSASRGVIRADDPDEFVTAFQRLVRMLPPTAGDPDARRVLVERYISGTEVALEGLLTHGELHVLALFDKPDPLEGPFFEETIYVTPSRLSPDTQAAIAACTQQAVRALGLRRGPVHAELRINEEGAWIIEVAGRPIGGLCSNVLRFGIDACLEELILCNAVGLPLPALEREPRAAGVMMIPIPRAGILREVRGIEAAKAVPGIEGVEITAKRNYPLVPLPEGDSYLGFIFARGDDPATVEAALREAHRCLAFEIEEPLPVLQTDVGL